MPPLAGEALRYDLADTSDDEAEDAWHAQRHDGDEAQAFAACPAARRGLKRAAAYTQDTDADRDARRKARRANLRLAGDLRLREGAVLTVCGHQAPR